MDSNGQKTMENTGGSGERKKRDFLLEALEENLLQLHWWEEQSVEREDEHAAALKQLKEQFEAQHAKEKHSLLKQFEEERTMLAQERVRLKEECERRVAEERQKFEKQIDAAKVDNEKVIEEAIAKAKGDANRQIANFRAECERTMTEERQDMADRIAESRAHCERMAAEKEGMSGRIAEFREETERYIAHEKEEMLKKTNQSRADCERIAKEKAEMMREMARFQEQTQMKMAAEKAELSKIIAEARDQCEKKLAEEKSAMERKILESKAEYERIEDEKLQVMRELAKFRTETERSMSEEQEDMKRKMNESRATCERKIAEEKLEMAREMAELRVEFERKAFQESQSYTQKISQARAEVEQLVEQKLQMSHEINKIRIASEAKIEEEMTELRKEFDRKLQQEHDKHAAMISEARAECDRLTQQKLLTSEENKQIRMESDNYAKMMSEARAECERLAEQKLSMSREMAQIRMESAAKIEEEMSELRAEYEKKMLQENDNYAKMMSEARAECERLGEQKLQMSQEIKQIRMESEAKIEEETRAREEEKTAWMTQVAQIREEYEQLAKQKGLKEREITKIRADTEMKMIELTKKTAEARAECERIELEKLNQSKEMAKYKKTAEKKLADEQLEMKKRIAESRAEYEQIVVQKAELAREMALFRSKTESKMTDQNAKLVELRQESEKLAKQKRDMETEMQEVRTKTLKKLEKEKEDMTRQMAQTRKEYEDQLEAEKKAARNLLAEARSQTEAQLEAERRVTSHIMQVIKELPPLQAAIELGDIKLLEEELEKWESDRVPERFGECRSVVQAVVKIAKERLITWREVEMTLHDVLRQMRCSQTGSVTQMAENCQRLFRALKEAQLTKMDLRRSDPQATEHICEVLLAWQASAMKHSNKVQQAMIRKVSTASNLGTFDFADLDICLRLVDRSDQGSEVLLTRALAIVQDENTQPSNLKPLLAHLETMLFFLKYTKSEDLALTHQEFSKQNGVDRDVANYIRWAAMECPPGSELVRLQPGRDIMDRKDVASVLEEMRVVRFGQKDNLGEFREIFYQWALVMRKRFDLLVLPHHVQMVCLMIFRRFLEAAAQGVGPHALIAQVGTGEGKSMIIAALAIYVVVVFKKKVHVVVDDETLLERDFHTFKALFDIFRVPLGRGKETRPLTSCLCVSEARLTAASSGKEPYLSSRLDPDVDVCYCEAKHVQSFYASVARGQKRDFDSYEDRVLILDEVDALVIDEEPNEAFVYPNKELSKMATVLADMLKRGASSQDLEMFRNGQHPAAQRVFREMSAEWARGAQLVAGEDYVYAKDAGRYHALQSGRANPKAWNLALECRNFMDNLSREIIFQERLFVMSRPRVFRKYYRILGLSGSIGSEAERNFLKETYRASFFEVPPFLKTCRGSPFHEPVPALLGELKRAIYVEESNEAQLRRLAEVALTAREKVPVLVIAKDRGHCDILVEELRKSCTSRGLGSNSHDLVRSLARTLYEADPEQWKENLNRATMPLGDGQRGGTSWRVTVTDPRGGRGTDYRVDFKEVDDNGGLLLIPTLIPAAQRDWTQYLGRTARQDRRGQYCAVLCSRDYEKLSSKYGEPLPTKGGLDTVETILSWGNRDVAERIRSSAALYNCGVRMNELCETIFSKHQQMLEHASTREAIVDVCQRFRFLSVKEVDEAFANVKGFNPASVPTTAKDLGRPAEAPDAVQRRSMETFGRKQSIIGFDAARVNTIRDMARSGNFIANGSTVEVSRLVVFCLDWSPSMMSQDTGTPRMTRFGICIDRVQRILREQVREQDLVSVVAFGANFQTVIAPTRRGARSDALEAHVASLRPSMAGGTCFYDAVAHCLTMMRSGETAPLESPRWLICLTDGDDLGSRAPNVNGEVVTRVLDGGIHKFNMIMITIGRLKDKNTRIIDGWVDRVQRSGGHGQHLSEKDAVSIGKAFEVVAEALAADLGGAVEC